MPDGAVAVSCPVPPSWANPRGAMARRGGDGEHEAATLQEEEEEEERCQLSASAVC